ncbi:MAG: hypothetical protein R3F13_19275 [Prosthecobacter sp.]
MKRLLPNLLVAALISSCTTAYDAQGRPRQVVDPGAALIGAAVVGLIAYGIANANDDDDCRRRNSGHRSSRYRDDRHWHH